MLLALKKLRSVCHPTVNQFCESVNLFQLAELSMTPQEYPNDLQVGLFQRDQSLSEDRDMYIETDIEVSANPPSSL